MNKFVPIIALLGVAFAMTCKECIALDKVWYGANDTCISCSAAHSNLTYPDSLVLLAKNCPQNTTTMDCSNVTLRDALMALYNSTNGSKWLNKENWGSDEPVSSWYGVQDRYLNLNSNNLVGKIPAKFFCADLQHIELNDNKLTGLLPETIGKSTNLKTFMIDDNTLYGRIPNVFAPLNLSMQYFSAKSNCFSGKIPSSLGQLPYLKGLNLAGNNLAGNPPAGFMNNTHLEAFHVECNANLTDGNGFKLDQIRENLEKYAGDLVAVPNYNLTGSNMTCEEFPKCNLSMVCVPGKPICNTTQPDDDVVIPEKKYTDEECAFVYYYTNTGFPVCVTNSSMTVITSSNITCSGTRIANFTSIASKCEWTPTTAASVVSNSTLACSSCFFCGLNPWGAIVSKQDYYRCIDTPEMGYQAVLSGKPVAFGFGCSKTFNCEVPTNNTRAACFAAQLHNETYCYVNKTWGFVEYNKTNTCSKLNGRSIEDCSTVFGQLEKPASINGQPCTICRQCQEISEKTFYAAASETIPENLSACIAFETGVYAALVSNLTIVQGDCKTALNCAHAYAPKN